MPCKQGDTNKALIGQKFNRLTIVSYHIEKTKAGKTQGVFNCLCECGNLTKVICRAVTAGNTKSCGCLHEKTEIGKKYSRLTIVSEAHRKRGTIHYRCICDCGKTTVARGTELRAGIRKSCGCISAENLSRVAKNNKGTKSPRWNFNKTREDRENGRCFQEYFDWRKSVYEKGNYICDICQSRNKLRAHHLASYADNREKRFDIQNGICLCDKCHREFHSLYGKSKNTPEQYLEYKNALMVC